MQTKIDKNLPLFKELKVNTEKLRVDLDDLTEKVNENTNKIDKNTNDITNLELKDNDFETRIENLEQGQGGGGTWIELYIPASLSGTRDPIHDIHSDRLAF